MVSCRVVLRPHCKQPGEPLRTRQYSLRRSARSPPTCGRKPRRSRGPWRDEGSCLCCRAPRVSDPPPPSTSRTVVRAGSPNSPSHHELLHHLAPFGHIDRIPARDTLPFRTPPASSVFCRLPRSSRRWERGHRSDTTLLWRPDGMPTSPPSDETDDQTGERAAGSENPDDTRDIQFGVARKSYTRVGIRRVHPAAPLRILEREGGDAIGAEHGSQPQQGQPERDEKDRDEPGRW